MEEERYLQRTFTHSIRTLQTCGRMKAVTLYVKVSSQGSSISVKSKSTQQNKHFINIMPVNTEIERRNRALVAFTPLTGARDSAIASLKLNHVDPIDGLVNQDVREVKTKFIKTFNTYFSPAGEEVRAIVLEWVLCLRNKKLWGNDDPLFPATMILPGPDPQFAAAGLERKHWSSASPIRSILL